MAEPDSDDQTISRPKTLKRPPLADGISMSTAQISRKSLGFEVPLERKAFLEILGLEGGPSGFALSTKAITLGRSAENDIHLPVAGISRVHARIFFKNEDYYVEDMGSTNGTYVSSIKVIRCVLRNNDQIEIGNAKLIFVEERVRVKSD